MVLFLHAADNMIVKQMLLVLLLSVYFWHRTVDPNDEPIRGWKINIRSGEIINMIGEQNKKTTVTQNNKKNILTVFLYPCEILGIYPSTCL